MKIPDAPCSNHFMWLCYLLVNNTVAFLGFFNVR